MSQHALRLSGPGGYRTLHCRSDQSSRKRGRDDFHRRRERQRQDDADRDDYRQYFSAIFFDFYLFERLIGIDGADEDEVHAHLARLDIAHKTSFRDGAFSTLDLSAGQRKRLALIVAYLENRPIVVLDEWAAEQDPTFRRIFYREILSEMKKKGKTLIVVSHDDRYFDAADRILQIKDGKIAEVTGY